MPRRSNPDLNSLIGKYSKSAIVLEIEKNLLIENQRSFLSSDLFLADVFDEKNYDLSRYEALEESLKKDGFLVPLIVSKTEGGYEIINGVKRYLLGKKIGLKEMPCISADLSEERKYTYILLNIQDEGDCPLVKTTCYKALIEKYHFTINQIAKLSNISPSQIRNLIRLDQLPEELKDALRKEELDYASARALLGLPEAKQHQLFEKIKKERFSVREIELEKRKHLGISKRRRVTLSGDQVILSFSSEKEAKKAYQELFKKYSQ